MKKAKWIVLIILFLFSVSFVILAQREWRQRWQSGQYLHSDSDSLGPGDHAFSLEHQDLKRQYYVHVPPSYDKNIPTPLVLNFHGGGASAEGHSKMTKMNKTSDREGFIVVYPRGMRKDRSTTRRYVRFWNYGEGPSGPYNTDPLLGSIDDVGFVSKMLDDLESKFNIDKNRIYVTGFSNGACLTHFLACKLSDRIAAIATVGGPFWHYPDECNLERAVPVMHFHGTEDVCAPYAGGPSGCEAGIVGGGRVFISVQETVDIWKDKNGCTDAIEITYQNGDVTCKTHINCSNSAEVTLCTVSGAGHTWPGGMGYRLPGFEIGEVTDDISASDAMWEFFKRHPQR